MSIDSCDLRKKLLVTRLRWLRVSATVSLLTTVGCGWLRVTDRELRVVGMCTGTGKTVYEHPNQDTGYGYAYAYAHYLISMECE